MSDTPIHLHDISPAELLAVYGLGDEDVACLRAWGAKTSARVDAIVEQFYVWLHTQPEYEEFIDHGETERRLRGAQSSYLRALFTAQYDAAYLESRSRVGTTHARIGLPLATYFGAMNHMMLLLLDEVAEDDDPVRLTRAIAKIIHLDTALVVMSYGRYTHARVAAQSKALLEMSTPVTELWQGVLMLPIVGIIDSSRAQDIMTGALTKISSSRARVLIMDISGVAVVDTAVANYLIKVTRATRLMGCSCILSGVSPAIAETIVELGIDVGTMTTTGTLMQALDLAFGSIGVRVVTGDAK